MAPIKPTNGLAVKDKAHGSRVSKPKKKSGPVRKLENGLLNVDRKAGKHVPTIKKNAQTPLLSLPAEIRNQIWEYVLGGRLFKAVRVIRTKHPRRGPQPTFLIPKIYFSLLQTCRQIYSESCLLPFSANVFQFSAGDHLEWLSKLRVGQQAAITTIRVASFRAMEFIVYNDFALNNRYYYSSLPDSLQKLSMLSHLKGLVVSVYQEDPSLYLPEYQLRLLRKKEEIKRFVDKELKDVQVTFE